MRTKVVAGHGLTKAGVNYPAAPAVDADASLIDASFGSPPALDTPAPRASPIIGRVGFYRTVNATRTCGL